jgi:hypothetical protein
MSRFLIPALALALASSACFEGRGTVAYSASASTDAEFVEVNPGVYAVANYNEPVFYANDYYWRYNSGRWYRSNSYRGGWAYATPPRAVVSIDRPQRYVRYRPQSHDRVVIRDSRGRWHHRR